METLPTWALEVIASCARGASHNALLYAAEEALSSRLFDTSERLWYSHYPQFITTLSRDLTTPDEWTAVPSAIIETIFGAQGDLSQVFQKYEPRIGQTALAHEILKALNSQRFLLAEAGTGVGKSLAYLVPAALWACYNNLPIIVSTNTRNLQSQLLLKDIPLVQKIVQKHLPEGVQLTAKVLKGRGNYLCLKRFGAYLDGGYESLSESESLLFAEMVQWAAQTDDGDLEHFRPTYAKGDMTFVSSFSCGSVECPGKKCRFYRRCFHLRARQEARAAHLVIVNHALVFADLMNGGKLLPPYANLIFDEAHNLEDVATSALADALSPLSLYNLCQKLAPSKGREIGSLFHHIQKDYIETSVSNPAERAKELQRLSDIRAKGLELAKVGKNLFTLLYHTMTTTPEKAVRYRSTPDKTRPPMADGQPQCRREFCLTKSHFIPAEPLLSEQDLRLAQDNLRTTITAITSRLDQLEVSIKIATPPDAPHHPHEELISSIGVMRDNLLSFSQSMDRLLAATDSNAVYWMEVHSEKERTVSLQSAPLDIASQLHQLLYKNKSSIIFSSATLRIRNTFEHIQHILGLHFIEPKERVQTFLAESPFDYPRQCCVAVPDYLPEINSKDHAYELELSRLMYSLFIAANGRSLTLFTSYEMMQFCAKTLSPHLEKKGIELLVQSSNMSRDAMTEAFREQTRPTVIFGTQSFWEGVDVVGEALSCVVIARLPFDVASSPLNAARGDRLTLIHRSPFNDLALPNALIKFRQGFGRLIRSRSDKGMVVIADTRITQKSYGYAFAQTLPCRIESFKDRRSIERRLKQLLNPPR